METVLTLQLIFVPVDLIVMLLCLLLPLCIVPRKADGLTEHSKRLISFCNCFAVGVFLSTCFLLLIPTVEMKMHSVLKDTPLANDHGSFAVTQSVILIGLFLMLLLEQAMKRCSGDSKESSRSAISNQVITIPESSSDEETIEFDAKFNNSETIKMLKSSSDGSPSKREIRIKKIVGSTGSRQNNSESHCHAKQLDTFDGNFGLRGTMLFLALSLHCVLEGVAVGLQDKFWDLINIYLAVLLHEALIAFAMGINLAQRRLATKTIIKLSVAFALLIPIGMAIGMVVKGSESVVGTATTAILQGIAAGTFIYIIFLEILPQELNGPKDPLCKLMFIFFGATLIVSFKFTLPH
jgi:zinc transporter 1/2/3